MKKVSATVDLTNRKIKSAKIIEVINGTGYKVEQGRKKLTLREPGW